MRWRKRRTPRSSRQAGTRARASWAAPEEPLQGSSHPEVVPQHQPQAEPKRRRVEVWKTPLKVCFGRVPPALLLRSCCRFITLALAWPFWSGSCEAAPGFHGCLCRPAGVCVCVCVVSGPRSSCLDSTLRRRRDPGGRARSHTHAQQLQPCAPARARLPFMRRELTSRRCG